MSSASSRRLRLIGAISHHVLRGIARAGRAVPLAHPRLHGVEVIRDIPYQASGRRAHMLDVYRPIGATAGARPAVLYVHGGAFGILDKDSHWPLALIFARRGYVVFNISYRLAPADPYPAAVEDTFAAYRWLIEHAHRLGGDPDRIVLAGDSAGGNLIAALTLAACYRRDEPHARAVWDTGVVPRVVVPTSAIFQVTDCNRFGRRRRVPRFVTWVLEGVERNYLDGARDSHAGFLDFADPVCVLERGSPPDRPLPPFFVAVGTKDPLLDDTRRLAAALHRLDAPCEARYYAGAIHVFHAAVWRRPSRAYWREVFEFLARELDHHDRPQRRRRRRD